MKQLLKKFFNITVVGLLIVSMLTLTSKEVHALGWDIIDKDMDARGTWRENIKNESNGKFTYQNGSVNIQKSNILENEGERYVMLITPTTFQLPEAGYSVEVKAKANPSLNETYTGLENEIGVRSKSKTGSAGQIVKLFLRYGDSTTGALSVIGANGTNSVTLDTSVYHKYQLIAGKRASDNTRLYDIYVDGILTFKDIKTKAHTDGNSDLIRMGADREMLSNMDVQYARAANGIYMSDPNTKEITSISLSDYVVDEGVAKDITASIVTSNIANECVATFTVLDGNDEEIKGVQASALLQNNQASTTIHLPSSLPLGEYKVQVSVDGVTKNSSVVKVKEVLIEPDFPTFFPKGENIPLDEFKYNPTQEWIFPSIIDTKEFPLANGAKPIDRYYLFYAPHDNPGGISLMSAPTLDGPWSEYDGNPLVSNQWGDYKVSHVSAADVVWNEELNKFVMYFHGENNVARYATSENLVDWTYGDVIFVANDFSPTNSGLTECSYQRVTRTPITRDGETYDWVMTLMVNDNKNVRRIYLAYSKDGINWITTKEPLISPENGKNWGVEYGTNIAGPFQFKYEGRNYIIVNASTGNLYAIEVGENYDKEIHWGMFYDSSTQWPDYGRSGGLYLKSDDEGKWHLFYEGGVRLHGNIIHAITASEEEKGRPNHMVIDFENPSLGVGESITPTVSVQSLDLNPMDFEALKKQEGVEVSYSSSNPDIASYKDGVLTGKKQGTTNIMVQIKMGDHITQSQKCKVTITNRLSLPTFEPGEIILDPHTMANQNGYNIGAPHVIDAKAMFGEQALGKYYLYYSYDTRDTGIGMAYADSLDGPWTPYKEGEAVVYRGLTGNGGTIPKDKSVLSPTVIWDKEKQQMNMYVSVNDDSIRLATSKDGITFQYEKAVFSTNTVGFKGKTTKTTRPMVYEHTIEGQDNTYVMLFGGKIGEMYQVDYATSKDGITWEFKDVLESPNPEVDGAHLQTPRLLMLRDELYLVSSNTNKNIVISSISKDFTSVNRIKNLMSASGEAPQFGRVSEPFFYQEGKTLHMYYKGGDTEKNTKIVHTSTQVLDKFQVQVEPSENGKVQVLPAYDTYFENDTITMTCIPDEGYQLDKVFENGKEIAISDNTYTIDKLQKDINIRATFTKIETSLPDDNEEEDSETPDVDEEKPNVDEEKPNTDGEKPSEPSTPEDNTPSPEQTTPDKSKEEGIVDTGDTKQLGLWMIVALSSCVGAILIVRKRKKG